ncbi:MAG TPA: glycosyltransferase family 2 protein [Acidimicrobiales bacterium]|jgi:glycosyltransferase involved in cell wall biosynthesis
MVDDNPTAGGVSPIPCTVGVLTFNSEATLERALSSVQDFDELLICDGGSSDRTREIAAAFGCRVIDQDPKFKDSNNRMIDISGCRQQMLSAAANPWVMMLDSDEYVPEDLVEEIRSVLATDDGTVGAYHVPRKYVIDDEVVECSICYPRAPLRMVRPSAGVKYHGLAHAFLWVPPGVPVETLSCAQHVPFPGLRDHWRRRLSYLRMEEIQAADLDLKAWFHEILTPSLKTIRLYGQRYYRLRLDCPGPRLPLRHELGFVAYQVLRPWYTGRRFLGLGRSDVETAWR